MGAPEHPGLLVPACQIKVNGQMLAAERMGQLNAARVDDEVDLPGLFELQFHGCEATTPEAQWLDEDPVFKLGDEVEVSLGYVDQLAVVIIGDVLALEPHFFADRPPSLTVRGFDRRHRFTRGRHSRTFLGRKDSDIAGEVANPLGVTLDAKDSGLKVDYVMQHDQTDLEFLRERARRIGYAITISGRTVRFWPANWGGSAAITLKMGTDIVDFEPRMTLAAQATVLRLRGWDVAGKQAIEVEAAPADVPKLGGKDTGLDLARRALGDAAAQVSFDPVVDRDEGEALAKAAFAQRALKLVSGEARLFGRTDFAAGAVVHIDGIGKQFSGDYYVCAVEHRYEPHRSFHTRIRVQRSAAG